MDQKTATITRTKVKVYAGLAFVAAVAFAIVGLSFQYKAGSVYYSPPGKKITQGPIVLPPLPEVCDDKIDNDKDGLTDCLDKASCSGTPSCPICNSLVVEPYGNGDPAIYRNWSVADDYFANWDLIHLIVRNPNTNPACVLTLEQAKFALKKNRPSATQKIGWDIKDIKLLNESAGWTKLAGPAVCDNTRNICNYDWGINGPSLQPGEEISLRVQADLRNGLKFKDGVYFYLRAPTGFTAKDKNGIQYTWDTSIDGIEAFLKITGPTDDPGLERIK